MSVSVKQFFVLGLSFIATFSALFYKKGFDGFTAIQLRIKRRKGNSSFRLHT